MGLLSNESQRNKLVQFLADHNQKLCVLSYTIGLVWFLALAYQPFNAGTYFSENALLPGLVETELPSVLSRASQIKDEVKAEMNKDQKVTPQNWLYEKFDALGLDTYRQNFSVVYPFRSLSTKVIHGVNVFAILRARRAASTEALVLSVPLRPVGSKEKPATGGGIALSLALAEEFKHKTYWAKDIIFLFTDFDEIGTMAWLDAYHGSKSEYILSEGLDGRSGPIQAAINLELPPEKISYFSLKLEGLNGQLPNLDLVNLVVKLCSRERARVGIHQSLTDRSLQYYINPNGDSFEDYKLALSTMLRMMWYQASGAPTGNHGLFHRFHIEALTLQGVKDKKGSRTQDLTSSARVIEGVFRSLNNLLERFHQSFFFYILPNTNRYISIGMYMPPFGLILAAGLIKGLALWVSLNEGSSSGEEEEEDKDKEEQNQKGIEPEDSAGGKGDNADGETKAEDIGLNIQKSSNAEGDGQTEDSQEEVPDKAKTFEEEREDDEQEMEGLPTHGMLTVIPVVLVSLLLGWMAYQGPELLTRIMPRFRIHTEDMVIYSLLAIFAAGLMCPKLMARKSNTPNKLILDWRLLKSIALICQTLALSSISLMNISQAFFLAAFMVPVTVYVRPTNSRLLRWLQMFLLVLISPMMLMMLVGFIMAWPQPSILTLCVQAFSSTKELIFLSVMDNYLFSTWTHSIFTGVIFPVWLFFWTIPWAEP